MREWDNDLDHRLARLVDSVPEVTWMDSSSIRRRGQRRRRVRHTVSGLACAVAVVLVVGGGWLVGCDGTGLPPVPPATQAPSVNPPSAAPSPEPSVEIPAAAMLTRADLAPYGDYQQSDSPPLGDWPLGYAIGYCTGFPWQPPPSGIAERYRHFTLASAGNVIMAAHRYAGDGADRAMDTYWTGLAECQNNRSGDNGYTMVPTEAIKAGDVILVRSVSPDRTMYYVYLRQGDVLAELAFYDGADEATATAVAVVAARRLCAAVTTC